MENGIKLDINKSVHENAASYYQRGKELRKKAESALKAIEDTKKAMREEEKKKEQVVERPVVRVKREKKWFERYHYFHSGEFLIIGGRDAKQNEEVVHKQFSEEDLFFHADIKGAPATVLKKGKGAPEKILEQVAQFAASFSSAWKAGHGTVDVYAVEKSQVSKEAQGEYLKTGSFVISGKRAWFKNVELALVIGLDGAGALLIVPAKCDVALTKAFLVKQGEKEKGEAAREIAKALEASVDEVLSLLPSGKFTLTKK
jgi:predicted ribosome quality control (RQC) complex YloA/Tae2 family protein